jgi:hypothetical protein
LKENVSNTLGLQADVDGVEEWDEYFGLVYGGPKRMEENSTAGRREDASSAVISSIQWTWWLPYRTLTYKSKFYYPVVNA